MVLDKKNAKAFNFSLKVAISNLIKQKVKVEIINSYKFPDCYVRVYPEATFPNDFRLMVFDAFGYSRTGLLDVNNVSYGIIQLNSIVNLLSCGSGIESQDKQKRSKALPLGESMTSEAHPISFAVGG